MHSAVVVVVVAVIAFAVAEISLVRVPLAPRCGNFSVTCHVTCAAIAAHTYVCVRVCVVCANFSPLNQKSNDHCSLSVVWRGECEKGLRVGKTLANFLDRK